MPIDYRRYPPNWLEFSNHIRFARARGQCECTGHCGLHGGRPNGKRCTERHHEPARWAKGTVRLTVAHLCDCDPPCQIPSHVLAMCQRCHLRVDRFKHARARRAAAARNNALPARKIKKDGGPVPPQTPQQGRIPAWGGDAPPIPPPPLKPPSKSEKTL
jgi:hypothetical protein